MRLAKGEVQARQIREVVLKRAAVICAYCDTELVKKG